MKRLLFLLALCLGTLGAWAQTLNYDFSTEAPTGQTLYYNITSAENLTVEVTYPGGNTPWEGYDKPTDSLSIPATVHNDVDGSDYTVTAIGEFAFSDCSGLTSVTIPNSVTSIGVRAFHVCSGLTSVTIPNSVTNIGVRAFSTCNGLTSVTIGESVETIGALAFSGCHGLTSVTIPNSVTSIGEGAFQYCNGLTGVTIPNSVTTIGDGAFYGCSGLTSVTIPNAVTTIGERAFYECHGLTSVTIPNSVTTIGSKAFSGCYELSTLYIPYGVTTIGDNAFSEGVGTVYYRGDATGSPWGAAVVTTTEYNEEGDPLVYDSPYKGMVIYCDRAATNVNIPNSVAFIGGRAFSTCSGLTSVTIPNSVTSIGGRAFDRCEGLTSVTIGESVKTIGPGAFFLCSRLTRLTIGNSVTSIGKDAFSGCGSLTSVTIPNSVTSIGEDAFAGCSSLKTVYNYSSNISFTVGTASFGVTPDRVVTSDDVEFFGAGANRIVKIDATKFTVGTIGIDTVIPTFELACNHVAFNGSAWRAKEVELTDDTSRFCAPVDFTADTVTYTREFADGHRSTLYLPFTAAIPDNFEVYAFSNYDNGTLYFAPNEDSIRAYTPYLVGYDLSKEVGTTQCTITAANAPFPASVPGNYHPATHGDMTFQGTLARTPGLSTNNYGYKDGFFVQSGGSAHVNPFRCYFTYTGGGAGQTPPPTLGVAFGEGLLGIDTPDNPAPSNGTIRHSNDVYDLMGRLVRKDAHSLDGLPSGIYIWKGRKVLRMK